MRPIKFKAKTSDGEWVEGDLVHVDVGAIIVHNKTLITNDNLPKGIDLSYSYDEFDVVYPNIICQFTGLVDKNGKEAYHYDKVLSSIYGEGFIQWCSNTAGFYIDFGSEDFINYGTLKRVRGYRQHSRQKGGEMKIEFKVSSALQESHLSLSYVPCNRSHCVLHTKYN